MNELISSQENLIQEDTGVLRNAVEIMSVGDFLTLENIRIPEYQRAYKWTEKNVQQLIEDIYQFRNSEHYRFGTIVIHKHSLTEGGVTKVFNDIVDGQQRYTTLRLIVYALNELVSDNDRYQPHTREEIDKLKTALENIRIDYSHKESIENMYKNYQLIKRSIQHFDDHTILSFIQNFQVVVFFITDETEAFQFFDSQNSRGLDLYPHDLLKAFHLREFEEKEKSLQVDVIYKWEKYPSKKLKVLFAEYLYRIKKWCNNQPAYYFNKNDIELFKGISLHKAKNYPFIKAMLIAHHMVDNYNNNFERNIDKQSLDYPFQIDQLVINGRRFFEYVDYYLDINERFKKEYLIKSLKFEQLSETEKLVYLIYDNNFIYREGERHIKALFECICIYYIDKFGSNDLKSFIEKAFVWCYYLRFKFQRIGFNSVDKYVSEQNLFLIIKQALSPNEVIKNHGFSLPSFLEVENLLNDVGSKRMDKRIIAFFKDKNYYV